MKLNFELNGKSKIILSFYFYFLNLLQQFNDENEFCFHIKFKLNQ